MDKSSERILAGFRKEADKICKERTRIDQEKARAMEKRKAQRRKADRRKEDRRQHGKKENKSK